MIIIVVAVVAVVVDDHDDADAAAVLLRFEKMLLATQIQFNASWLLHQCDVFVNYNNTTDISNLTTKNNY